MIKTQIQASELKEALAPLSGDVKMAILFSFFVNIMILAPTWYMLEVYDRVVNSQDYRTLLMLTILIVFVYVLLEMLEWVRGRIMHEAGNRVDLALRERVFNAIFEAKLRQIAGGTTQALFDLKSIQDAIASPALMALIDLPFAIITFILIFAINMTLGWFALAGAALLGMVAIVNQYRVQPPLMEANRHSIAAQNYAGSAIRNAQVIEAMGMMGRIRANWMEKQDALLRAQALASDRAGVNASLSKLVTTLQGSLLLGLGCYLLLQGELSGGGSMMIIGSILGGRVLAPLVTIVGNWRTIMNTQDAIGRLDKFLKFLPETKSGMALPQPSGYLSVEGAMAAPPNSQVPILKGVSFRLPAGESLGVVGPSASGKTTLARLITGIWPAFNGKVRLDGADIYTWNKAELGPHVGYLPQDVELFDGTLAENIARFGEVDLDKVKAAAQLVGLTNFIDSLKDGYKTQVGEDGAFLSGGQRQLVALARAVYDNPRFVVLDEPNSSLDEAGDAALMRTLAFLKSAGTTVIVITHRGQVLTALDNIMVLVDGQIKAFGPRDDVLNSLNPQSAASPSAQPSGGTTA
ncbi:type I secretion system ATP-binding protein PrsD [mine drainage metagenome]|uniref:Type I secretion system ATP-binding protein PrsD n=1 Tax=mine drainage metagenome TaxID=410659 RepID=A0A1J5QDC6_9ZZZZ